jgi:hypothetical protein
MASSHGDEAINRALDLGPECCVDHDWPPSTITSTSRAMPRLLADAEVVPITMSDLR